jgi:hypothetical protein
MGFHGDFGVVGDDPSKETWWAFIDMIPRYKVNTQALFLRTWKWVG